MYCPASWRKLRRGKKGRVDNQICKDELNEIHRKQMKNPAKVKLHLSPQLVFLYYVVFAIPLSICILSPDIETL